MTRKGNPTKNKLLKIPVRNSQRIAPVLLMDVREMILDARQSVATTVNATISQLYWRIGQRVRRDILRGKRAEYGQEILSTLSKELSVEFGRGFDGKSLRHMIRFAEAFPEEKIVSALRRQLSWTHIKRLIYLPRHAGNTNLVYVFAGAGGPFGNALQISELY